MTLYDRHNYLNKSYSMINSRNIIEYDMKSAGYNILIRDKLIDQKTINRLGLMMKKERNKAIGLMQRRDKDLAKALNEGFVKARKEFFLHNEIHEDDVLSIKKDAIFLFRYCEHCQFDNIVFDMKNKYSSYLYLDGKEIYYNKDKIDLKGIDDKLVNLHKDYMCAFIHEFLKLMETSSREDKAIEFIREFGDLYKTRKLPADFYRELNKTSLFKTIYKNIYYHDIGDSILNEIDILYNYLHIIVPLQNLLI